MADEVRIYPVLIPKGTLASAPQVTALPMPQRLVQRIQILVPPGPGGMVGFQLAAGGQSIVPYNDASWIVTNNEVIDWPLEGMPEAGSWQLHAYNIGRFDHTLTVRMLLGLPEKAPVKPLTPIVISALSGVLS